MGLHMIRVGKILISLGQDHLAAANLTVNLSKCEFDKATVTYLGKVVGQGHVHPVRAKVTANDQFPIPTTKKGINEVAATVEKILTEPPIKTNHPKKPH